MTPTAYPVKTYPHPIQRYCQTLDLRDDPVLLEKYKYIHSRQGIWQQVLDNTRSVGILEMEIYMLGTRLFMIVDTPVDFDWDTAMNHLATLSPQQEWEDYMTLFQVGSAGAKSTDKWRPMERIFHLYE